MQVRDMQEAGRYEAGSPGQPNGDRVVNDPDDDAVERAAKRVGRALGALAVAALAVYLAITYL
ncbi:hypothetical protein GCM10007904_01470 [Oharaeibacter diazotrophicus]|nr:hypothetical protein GCM10007904_01470 [Oharaeibacter diazotrophicus]